VLTLSARGRVIDGGAPRERRRVVRVQVSPNGRPTGNDAALLMSEVVPQGYATYLAFEGDAKRLDRAPSDALRVVLPESFRYVGAGDILGVRPESGELRSLYRRNSKHNSFLVTERCNSYCLMCSQPPRDVDDAWIVDELLEAIPLVDPETRELGFTGGEPTLQGERFVDVLRLCRNALPATAIHVLSNGRNFANSKIAEDWASVRHPDLMVGIPLYSDVSEIHDYVVQADGAYDETIRGILNLKRLGVRVEVRLVLHQQTYRGLPRLAEFIARNLLFVDHVALMGLEIMGFTRANLDILWVDPSEYQVELRQAVRTLTAHGIRVSIYNHQLCLLDRDLWPYAVQSISDWKNEYIDECKNCGVVDRCGGFFASAKYKRSDKIRAIAAS
jgi:His-Xaa-Ser system radical SAM maturase HxsC